MTDTPSRAHPHAGSEVLSHAVIEDLYQRGKVAWPEVPLVVDVFARYLNDLQRRSDETSVVGNAVDLYLICGCLSGSKVAERAFIHGYLEPLIGINARGEARDDLRQVVLERLLTSEDGRKPRLSEYSGRSSLRTWLKVVVKRCSLNLARGAEGKLRCDPCEELEQALIAPAASPELDYLKTRYAAEFRRAFRSALRELEARDALVLRMHVCEGGRTADIAACFGVNRVTITRWLQDIQQQLLSATRRYLEQEIGVSRTEFESVVKLVISSFDLTFSGLERSAVA
jgi:RNA polymerase sigma-70 factor (ECF subfamily)